MDTFDKDVASNTNDEKDLFPKDKKSFVKRQYM